MSQLKPILSKQYGVTGIRKSTMFTGSWEPLVKVLMLYFFLQVK
jgi:hypothetical protein